MATGRWWGGLLGGALMATAAQAQLGGVTVGGDARILAMGGAGVATLGGANRVNPASLAFEKGAVRFYLPSVGLRAGGAMGDLKKVVDQVLGSQAAKGMTGLGSALAPLGGESADRAASAESTRWSDLGTLARDFASRDSDFGVNASFGIRLGHLEVTAGGAAQGRLQPDAALQAWGRAGSTGDPPSGAQAHLLAAGVYTLPSIGAGFTVPTGARSPVRIALGGRVKRMTAVYVHGVAEADGARLTGRGAPEMEGRSALTREGVGADLGFLVESRGAGPGQLSAGFVVTNAIKPSGMAFLGTDREGAARRYDLLATTATAGVGYRQGGLTLAADLVDLTGGAQLRVGGEQRLGPLSLRAGFSSGGGLNYGVGFLGIDVAFGGRQPLEVVRTIRF